MGQERLRLLIVAATQINSFAPAIQHTMRKLFLLLIWPLLCASAGVQAQQQRFSGWLMGMNTLKLNERFLFQFDVQLRSADQWKKTETVIVRPVLSYMLNKETALGLGYAAISNWRTIDGIRDNINEKRLWQQLNINKHKGSMAIQHRFRLEERWLPKITVEQNAFKGNGHAFNSRLRYMTRVMGPFKKSAPFTKGLYWAAQNEFFLNLWGADVVNKKMFDQSRSYVGAGYRISNMLDAELGYMFVHTEGKGKAYSNNNIIQLSSLLRL